MAAPCSWTSRTLKLIDLFPSYVTGFRSRVLAMEIMLRERLTLGHIISVRRVLSTSEQQRFLIFLVCIQKLPRIAFHRARPGALFIEFLNQQDCTGSRSPNLNVLSNRTMENCV